MMANSPQMAGPISVPLAAYHTPPVVVSAICAGLLTKVGVYALIRVFTLLFVQNPAFLVECLQRLLVGVSENVVEGHMNHDCHNETARFAPVERLARPVVAVGYREHLGGEGAIHGRAPDQP